MHILNGFNAEMCLGLTVTLITAPHTDKYAIATIKSYPIMGKIFLYLINKSIKEKKVLTMVHFLKTLLQLQKMGWGAVEGGGRVGVNTPSFCPPLQLFLISLALSQEWFWGLFFFSFKPLLLVFPVLRVSYFFRTREKADTQETEKLGSVLTQRGA